MSIFWKTIYNLLILPLLLVVALLGSLFNAKLREGFRKRFSSIRILKSFFAGLDRHQVVYWFHVASHGEYEIIRTVLKGLKEVEPKAVAVVSFFSPSGFNHVQDDLVDCKVYLPFDWIWSVRRALKIVHPKKIIFAAYDVWPNLIWTAKRFGIHATLVAARLERGTKKLWPVARSFYHSVYRCFATIYTVAEWDYLQVQKLVNHPVRPLIRVLGNPRYDQVKSKADSFTQQRTESVLRRQKRLIVGSVHKEDERVILEPLLALLKENLELSMLWVPHEPSVKNCQLYQNTFRQAGLGTRLLNNHRLNQLIDTRVIIVDGVGKLARLYWQGRLAYVGGGFSTGVHNVMEPAIARLPVLFGPRYQNSHEATELLKAGGGFTFSNQDELLQLFHWLLNDQEAFLKASLAATAVIHKNLGSSTRVVRGIIRD